MGFVDNLLHPELGPEDFEEPRWARFLFASSAAAWLWLVVRLYMAYVWLPAGWEKITSGKWLFGDGAPVAGFVGKAVADPGTPTWYVDFANSVVLPNAGLFATLVALGEFAVGLGLLVGLLTGFAAFFAVFMSANYILSGVLSSNPVMIVLGLFLVVAWRNAGWIGLDRLFLPWAAARFRARDLTMRVTVTPEQIREAFEEVKDDPSFDESRGLWERGRPPVEMIQAMCLRPEILRGFAGFGGSVYPGGLLERRVKELVIITASESNECQFCTNSHCDLVRIGDIVDEPLIAIANPAGLAPRERVAVEYTRAAMTDSNHIPAVLSHELKEMFTDPELVELTFLIGFINMLNLFNNCLEVRYAGEYSLLTEPVGS